MTLRPGNSPEPLLQHVIMTAAAIIQAAAFTELVQSEYFKCLHFSASGEDWLRLLAVAAVFLIIVTVWFGEVANFIGYGLWPKPQFGFLDALIPFAIGATEIKLVQTLDDPREW